MSVLPAGASRASPLTIPAPPQNGFFRYRAFFRRTKRTRFAQTPFCLIVEKTPVIGPFRVGTTAVPATSLQYNMPDSCRSQLAGDALVAQSLTRRDVAATPGLYSLWDRCPTGKNLAKTVAVYGRLAQEPACWRCSGSSKPDATGRRCYIRVVLPVGPVSHREESR